MTRKLNIDNGLQDWKTEHQAVTACKRNCLTKLYLDNKVIGFGSIRLFAIRKDEEYVIILEPQRSGLDYFLITAYHLNEPGGKKQIMKKQKRKLDELH